MSGSTRAVDVTDSTAFENGRIPKTDSMVVYFTLGFSIIMLLLALITSIGLWFVLGSIVMQVFAIYTLTKHFKKEALAGNRVLPTEVE